MITFAGRWRYTLLCLALLLAAVIYLLVTHQGWRMWAATGLYAVVVAINGVRGAGPEPYRPQRLPCPPGCTVREEHSHERF